MHVFLAVSEGILSLNKAREILPFSQIMEKKLYEQDVLYILLGTFDTQRLNSVLNPLDF